MAYENIKKYSFHNVFFIISWRPATFHTIYTIIRGQQEKHFCDKTSKYPKFKLPERKSDRDFISLEIIGFVDKNLN